MFDDQVLRAWEERIILSEKGRRLVHYILKDSVGNSVLAVVGRDRSVNHMTYEISEDFLCVFGSTSTVHAGTKWRARRDVVEWLISVVSRGGPLLANPANPTSGKCQVSWQSNNRWSSTKEIEASTPEEPLKRSYKRTRGCRVDLTLLSSFGCLPHLDSQSQMVRWEPTRKRLKMKPSTEGLAVTELAVPGPWGRVFPKINENTEILSQDSGMQGCWFRCSILCSSESHLKVQYLDFLEVDGPGKLEEWIPASRVAAPDKLGVRCVGRLMIRPWPCEDSSDITFEVGAAVDAWWSNGWWEGVVIGYDTPTNNNLQVYFPGENRFLTIARKNIRVSRDWVNNKWVNVKTKPDILSSLSSIFSTGPKVTRLHDLADANSSTPAKSKVLKPRKLEKSEDDRWEIPSSLSASTNVKTLEELNLKKRLINRYNEEMERRSFD